ncbi:hypothetical protein [Pseudoalteromonas sp. bablab_jr011]|uniref:hypothetical protein n=1 Tax=Pseudoalteromonas sp. bablab_jr011 TaxID=2755062 RepID=UPI0018F6968E|nr:hypothetical protein [Pseudoalteromonas sp. bablab_jr011]
MESEVRYRFDSQQTANRFLNKLRHWSVSNVKASLCQGGFGVKIRYEADNSGFDYTLAELDDLAMQHEGIEF